MSKWRLCISIVAGAVIFVTTTAALAADDLVIFNRTAIQAVQESANIRVFAKLDNLAAALIEGGNFNRIRKIEKSARFIQSSVDIDLLWVMKNNEDIPNPPGILVSTDNYYLLELNLDQALELMAKGAFLSKLDVL